MGKTIFDKVWDAHIVDEVEGGQQLLYIDLHFIHEVTSPQSFAGLKQRGLPVMRPSQTVATADHNVPTINQHLPIREELSRLQVDKLVENCTEFGVEFFGLGHDNQGIVHIIGPELGLTKPGMTIVCGDSHTSTHGAFGSVAFGIGTSQVEQVLASQCLLQVKPKKMLIEVDGYLDIGVTAKDIILYVISQLGTGGATGFFVEYRGSTISDLSMAGRMTICNMSIEMGARGGLIGVDQTTIDYVQAMASKNDLKISDGAIDFWLGLNSDTDCSYDIIHRFKAEHISPMLTYGTNPGMGMKIDGTIPSIADHQALEYMGFSQGEALIGKQIQHVFIGSCTNARMEDLRQVATYLEGKRKASHVTALIVPGSKNVEKRAKEEGIDKIFKEAGFEFREPGCSACLGMNEDKIPAGEYCVSTSNRNFQGRQGPGARTLLASPLTAAAAAVHGKIVDVRTISKIV